MLSRERVPEKQSAPDCVFRALLTRAMAVMVEIVQAEADPMSEYYGLSADASIEAWKWGLKKLRLLCAAWGVTGQELYDWVARRTTPKWAFEHVGALVLIDDGEER